MNLNEKIAIIEIQNVLELYENQDSVSISNLLEISHDLPIGNLEEDTKSLINLILKHNFIENKDDIINKSKILTESKIKAAAEWLAGTAGAGVVLGAATKAMQTGTGDVIKRTVSNDISDGKTTNSNPLYDKVRNSAVGKFVAKHPVASAVAGIAGLGYTLWKKFSGNKDRIISALESKKSICPNDECISAINKEIAKIRNKEIESGQV